MTVVWDVLSSLGLMNKVNRSPERIYRDSADEKATACQAPLPRTVRTSSVSNELRHANETVVTMPERPRMILTPVH
jgi:hypothetical protein